MSSEDARPTCSIVEFVNGEASSGDAEPRMEIIDDKAPLWKFVKKLQKQPNGGNCKWQCNFCKLVYNGSYTRVRCHLLKEGTSGVAGCSEVTPDVYNEMMELVKECKERLLKANPRQVLKATPRQLLKATPKQVCLPVAGIQKCSASSSHEESYHACNEESLKNLTEENEKLKRKNDRCLELWDKACEENHALLEKNKLLDNERKNLAEVVLQQREMIDNLQTEVSKLERQLLEKETCDSLPDVHTDSLENNNSDGEEREEESGGDDFEDGRKPKQGRASEKEKVRKLAIRSKRVNRSATDGEQDLKEEPAKKMRRVKKQAVKS